MRVAAFATILDNERNVLLIRRRDVHVWECPGGGAHADESPWDAVRREVAEETHLQVLAERLTGIYWRPKTSVLVFQFLCSVVGGCLAASPEARDLAYFAVTQLPERLAPVVSERMNSRLA